MDQRQLVVKILEEILGVTSKKNQYFNWCVNRMFLMDTLYEENLIGESAIMLNWALSKAQPTNIPYDGYLPGKYNCLFVYDDFFKFSSHRLKTLNLYPDSLRLNFDLNLYKSLCHVNSKIADSYQRNNVRKDFNFIGGANAKRALHDVMLDVRPIHHGLNPTFRLNYYSVFEENSGNVTKNIELAVKRNLK